MSAPRANPPSVDDGGPASLVSTVLEALAPSPGRLHSTLLVLVPMLAVLVIWETFRIPQPAIATFLPLVMARGDARSSMGSSLTVAATVGCGALIAIVVLALSLSQPALRIPLMALMTFTSMFLVRATTLGPIAFLAGFFATYGSMQADNLAGLAMAPDQVTNTEGFGRPAIAFFPPEEAAVHALLWLAMAAAIPALLLAITERAAGADPRRLLRARLSQRTDAIAAYARGQAGAVERLRATAREGLAPLLALIAAAETEHRLGAAHDAHLRLARALNRLALMLIAWDMARPSGPRAEDEAIFLAPIGDLADALAARSGARRRAPPELPVPSAEAASGLGGALPSLAVEIEGVCGQIRLAEHDRVSSLRSRAAGRSSTKLFWQPHPFSAPNVQFALKVTLTVMTSYLLEIGLDWGAISTCVVTSFMVALGTAGETIHKMTLRIVGCLVGAALGLGIIAFLMPSMTGFGQLIVLFAPVAFASAWIGFGSPRISYAGWQILLAFSLTVLQGYGPTLDMQTARDRVIGILLGNLVTTLVFLFVWPVRVGDAVRRDMAGACEMLGQMVALEASGTGRPERHAAEGALRESFTAAVTRIGGVMPNDRFEPASPTGEASGHLDRAVLARLGRMVVPASVIATDAVDHALSETIPPPMRESVHGFSAAMRDWYGQVADWIRTGRGRDKLAGALPEPPAIDDEAVATLPLPLQRRVQGRVALCALLCEQAGDFLDAALPAPAREKAPVGAGRTHSLAAG